jgi:hypothetical protein
MNKWTLRSMKHLLLLALIVGAAIACQKTEPMQADTAASAEKTYTMNGKLVSRDAAKNEVTIDNEEVPGGVMAAMVMAYEPRLLVLMLLENHQQQSSPRHASTPSRMSSGVMPRAATGSAHHHPNAALSPMPARVMMESHQQAVV